MDGQPDSLSPLRPELVQMESDRQQEENLLLSERCDGGGMGSGSESSSRRKSISAFESENALGVRFFSTN